MMRFAKETCVVVLLALGVALSSFAAHAADKGRSGTVAASEPSPVSFLPVGEWGAKAPWSGLWVGGYASHTIGTLDFGAPAGLFSDGQTLAPAIGFDVQTGRIVWGAEVAYGWVFGNLNDIGIDNVLSVGGRVGFLPTKDVLLYGHGGWSRVFTSGSDFDGWTFGPGVEVKLPDAKGLSLDIRYAYGIWDIDGVPSGVDVNSHAFLVGVKYRFGQ